MDPGAAEDQSYKDIKNRLKLVVKNCFGQFKLVVETIERFWKTVEHSSDIQRSSKIVRNSLSNIQLDDLFVLEQIDQLLGFGEINGLFENRNWSNKFIQNPLLVMHFMGIE